MEKLYIFLTIAFLLFSPLLLKCQEIEKVTYDDVSINDYYLAIPPTSHQIKGVVVLLCSFRSPESLLPETRLHNITVANDLLMIYASVGPHIIVDSLVTIKLSVLLRHIAGKYKTQSAKFILGGFDFGGAIALRYIELVQMKPQAFAVVPSAVFAGDSFVDMFGLKRWCERQINKNYYAGSVGEAKFLLTLLPKNESVLVRLTPFRNLPDSLGNEQWLLQLPVRLYYDNDPNWQLKERHNSLYDTNLPDGTELISRLLGAGNKDAELILAKQPGRKSNGARSPDALSIIDETDFITWAKQVFGIFDPLSWKAPYQLKLPAGWNTERFALPPPFAPLLQINGVEEAFFPAGWADKKSVEYWSYAYSSFINGHSFITAELLQKELTLYFDGLVKSNVKNASPCLVHIKPVKTAFGDMATFSGTVSILDYMSARPIILNTIIHQKSWYDKTHLLLFYEFSPGQYNEHIFKQLEKINESFVRAAN